MKTEVLQGINLENNITTIKIFLDKKINEKIIKDISKLHPIFLKKYEVKNKNEVHIQSKLPSLWIEIGKILNKKIDEKEQKKEIFEKIIKKQILSMSTIAVLEAADKLNEEITKVFKTNNQFERQYRIGCGIRSESILSFKSSKDSDFAKQIQMDKYLTNTYLEKLNIPIAKWDRIKNEKHLLEIFKEYNKPVVIKPTSLTSGHGVHTNIKISKEAIEAFRDAKEEIKKKTKSKKRNFVIIQKQVTGDDYRILVVNGKLEAATKRVPAFVEGDGKQTINELINEINKDERRNVLNPTHTLKPIVIDNMLKQFLKKQKLNGQTIPKKKEKIFVRKVASMSQGGITIDFTDKVHKQIKYISESIAQSLNAYTLGVDIMCRDISKPLTIENGSIIEINTMPEAYLNIYPVIGKERNNIARNFVKGLLKDKKKTRKIVIIGGKKNSRPKCSGITGIYYNNSIYINNELINKNIETNLAVESLKINSYLENIILHYKDIQEVEKYGLGFDEIDELYFNIKYNSEVNKLSKILIKKHEVFNN